MGLERSPEELAGGFLEFDVGGSTRRVTTLKIRAERDWKLLLAETIGQQQVEVDLDALKAGGDKAYAALTPLANMATDAMLILILAYDKAGSLGGRDWLEEHADSAQIYFIFQRMLKVVFPFASDLRTIINELRNLMGLVGLVRLGSSSSTNGASDTGPELTSKIASTTGN